MTSHDRGFPVVIVITLIGVIFVGRSVVTAPTSLCDRRNGFRCPLDSPVTTVALGPAAFPAGVSADHRYLVDQRGQPFLLTGDSPHALAVDVSTADADFYLADRAAHGFNAIWVEALCDGYTGGRADGATFDGIAPFTTPGDLTTPNPAYWERLDAVVSAAAKYGITVLLDPIDLAGWIKVLRANGPDKARAYGEFLGGRYAAATNIVWQHGNDYQTWRDPVDDGNAIAVAEGIRSRDPHHLQTIELNFQVSTSLDDPRWAARIDFNDAYSYYPTYDVVSRAWAQSPTMPVVMIEANYEWEANNGVETTFETLRRQEYWTATSGATGQLFGNRSTWTFPADWKSGLDTVGVQQLGYMRAVVASEKWWLLAPDPSLVTDGQGHYDGSSQRFDLSTDTYASAAVASDGSFAFVYVPSMRTISLDLSHLQANATARWYDPTTGTWQAAVAPFRTPGRHTDGASDWLLVLDAPHATASTTSPPASATASVP